MISVIAALVFLVMPPDPGFAWTDGKAMTQQSEAGLPAADE